jgi:hypothetical protein
MKAGGRTGSGRMRRRLQVPTITFRRKCGWVETAGGPAQFGRIAPSAEALGEPLAYRASLRKLRVGSAGEDAADGGRHRADRNCGGSCVVPLKPAQLWQT